MSIKSGIFYDFPDSLKLSEDTIAVEHVNQPIAEAHSSNTVNRVAKCRRDRSFDARNSVDHDRSHQATTPEPLLPSESAPSEARRIFNEARAKRMKRAQRIEWNNDSSVVDVPSVDVSRDSSRVYSSSSKLARSPIEPRLVHPAEGQGLDQVVDPEIVRSEHSRAEARSNGLSPLLVARVAARAEAERAVIHHSNTHVVGVAIDLNNAHDRSEHLLRPDAHSSCAERSEAHF